MEMKFWKIMANALIAYDFSIKDKNVRLALCDTFMEGAYIPSDN
jgi:hypothetical protein